MTVASYTENDSVSSTGGFQVGDARLAPYQCQLFGFGGTNVYVILDDTFHYLHDRNLDGKHKMMVNDWGLDADNTNETINEAIGTNQSSFTTTKQWILVSGKDQTSTKRVFEGLNSWLEKDAGEHHSSNSLEDLAHTLGERRTHLEYRSFVIADSLSELSNDLAKDLSGVLRSQRNSENLIMVFTEQGAQLPMTGKKLFSNPIFRQSVEILQTHLDEYGCTWNAIEELSIGGNKNIDRPEYS